MNSFERIDIQLNIHLPNYKNLPYNKGVFCNGNEIIEYDTIKIQLKPLFEKIDKCALRYFDTEEGKWIAENAFQINFIKFYNLNTFNMELKMLIKLSTINITAYHFMYGVLRN